MTYWLRALITCNGGFTPRILTPLCSSIIELQFALTYRLVSQEGLEPYVRKFQYTISYT